MAGSYGSKPNPKNKGYIKNNNNEALKDLSTAPAKKSENKLFGILFPGQSVEINKKETTTNISWNREFLIKSVVKEQSIFINNHSQEVERTIKELRLEIKKLIEVTENIDQSVVQSTEQNVVDFSEYQLNFFQRLKMIIVNFRKNISEAGVWMESFNHKKSKCNAYRNKSKSGGTKYTDSGEHAVARSAN